MNKFTIIVNYHTLKARCEVLPEGHDWCSPQDYWEQVWAYCGNEKSAGTELAKAQAFLDKRRLPA